MTGAREDLEEAVARRRRVLELLPADLDVGFADMLGNVANALRLRSALTGDGADLDEAIGLYRRAVEITPAENADRAKVCGNLSAALSERFLRTDSEADLTDALGAAREALSAAIPGSAAYHLAETSYARVMADRFLRTGNRADLDEAIIRFRRVAAESDDPAEINALGAALQRRYDLIGSIADLQGAIAAFDAVLAATAPLSSQHTTTSGNLGNALTSRYRLTGDRADIDRAIEALRHAQAHAEVTSLSMVHINLAKALSFRYESLGENADLDTAVEEARLAYETLPPGSSRRRAYRAGWAAQLLHRTSRGRGEDLDQAIEILTDIVGPAAGSGPEDGIFLFNLAEALLTRNTGDDRTKAVAALRTATQMETCAAEIRVRSARRWASTAYADGDTGAALDALRAAVQLLPLLAWRGISRSDQERGLADLTGLAGEAAALALIEGQPELAVELLEHGRAVLWAQLLETRTDLTALAEADPALAARLTEVRAALDADLTGEPGQVTLDRTALAGEWDELVQRVRGLPGFEGFLHPPEFMELAQAADEGPVVILNVTALRCDALIVRERTVTVAALPDVTAAEVAEWANTAVTLFAQPSFGLAGAVALHRGTEELLRWLGTRITGPVLDAVGTAPRMWWCPTGPLGVLPLHAAIDAAGVCALDRTISSYTPTLRMLIEARARPEDDPRHRRALVIAMDSTPGAPNLNVQPEIDLVRNLFGARCTVLSQPSVDEVRRELPGHLWIHFACHGLQDPDQPSRNGVALSDGVLTVLDIAALSSQAELAFLSACRTASVGAVLTDEAIHLASALHATGFRHVIATLWPVFDATAPLMARRIYEQLPNVAFAVNAAARNLRAEDRTALPALWAPYVHIGP